ncbi:MAG: ABC transporter permease [Candidatus Hodarchaeales archaeon]|jgi:ABC-2 type transport system permease protein
MAIPRVLVVAGRSLRQVVRDRRTLVMILAVPIVVMLIFGFAIGGEVEDAPVAVIIEDEPVIVDTEFGSISISIAAYFLDELKGDSRLDVSESDDFAKAKENVDKGELNGAIYFPKNFTKSMMSNATKPNATISGGNIELYIDSTIPQTQAAILSALQDSQLQALERLSAQAPGQLPFDSDKLQVESEFANNGKDFSGLDVAVPAVIAFVINFIILLLTTLIFVRERSYGTRERLMITPLRPQEHVGGYILTGIMLAIAESMVILVISIGFFGAQVRGNILLLFVGILLYGTTFVCLGAFLSNFARNELQAVQMGPLVALPSMALSGFLVPIQTLPNLMQHLSNIVPLTYGIIVFKGIMLKGHGLEELWFEFGVISLFCVAALALALLTVREYNE